MVRRLPLLSLLFLLTGAQAQSTLLSITGTVVEKQSREPLEGAAVGMFQSNDSTLIQGTVTDSSGAFDLRLPAGGEGYLTITFIGFLPYRTDAFPLRQSRDLGVIELGASDILLNTVTVTAEQSKLIYQLDKKIYNVGKDVLAESGSVSELLQNIPSVSVDIDGGITLRNTGNITFFLNGRPSALLRRNASAALEQIPANTVERIEIITNPSAQYRPDGVGGIINIVLKKEAKPGWNGLVSASAGTERRYNGSLNLNYGGETLKLFGNYGIRHSAGTYLFTEERLFKTPGPGTIGSRYRETGTSRADALSHNAYAGMNIELGEFNTLELSVTYFSQNTFHNGAADISSADADNRPEYRFRNDETNDEAEEEGEASFSWEHVFKNNEDHTLSLEAAYSSFDETEDLDFRQTYSLPAVATELRRSLIRKGGDQTELILDYTRPIGEEGELTAGYNGEFIFENIRYDNDNGFTQFLLQQKIQALYALYGQSWERFSFKAGLRAEHSRIVPHLRLPVDSLIFNTNLQLFPTLHLGLELNEGQQLSLSYSRRLNRPDADELNPNPEYSDPRHAEAGNPNIRPEQTHSVELGYLAHAAQWTVSTTFYYQFRYDAFTSIRTTFGDSVVVSTLANLNTRRSAGIEAGLSGKIGKGWQFDLTGNVYYTTIDATDLGFADRRSAVSGNLRGFAQVKLGKGATIQVNALYYFPAITPQGARKAYFYWNGGIRQSLFRHRALLTLTGTDLLHTYQIRRSIQSDELDQRSSSKRKLPVVYLAFSWRFNNYNAKEELNFEGETLK